MEATLDIALESHTRPQTFIKFTCRQHNSCSSRYHKTQIPFLTMFLQNIQIYSFGIQEIHLFFCTRSRKTQQVKPQLRLLFRQHQETFGSLKRLQPRCRPGLQSSEGLTGVGGFISKVAHSYGWQVEFLFTWVSTGFLNVLTKWQLISPEQERQERVPGRSQPFCDLDSEIMWHYFHQILFIRSEFSCTLESGLE